MIRVEMSFGKSSFSDIQGSKPFHSQMDLLQLEICISKRAADVKAPSKAG